MTQPSKLRLLLTQSRFPASSGGGFLIIRPDDNSINAHRRFEQIQWVINYMNTHYCINTLNYLYKYSMIFVPFRKDWDQHDETVKFYRAFTPPEFHRRKGDLYGVGAGCFVDWLYMDCLESCNSNSCFFGRFMDCWYAYGSYLGRIDPPSARSSHYCSSDKNYKRTKNPLKSSSGEQQAYRIPACDKKASK